jgi:2Fe-2S ferredoxin
LARHTTVPAHSKLKIRQNVRDLEITAVPGLTVLHAALAQQKPIDYKCGKGACGRCAIRVLHGASLTPPTKKEMETLQAACSTGIRLACQAIFSNR